MGKIPKNKMARSFWKNSSAKDIILTLAKVGCFMIAATSPYFLHQVIRSYFREQSRKEVLRKARKLRELERRKIVAFKELSSGEVRIELTKNGKRIVHQYNFNDMRLQRPEKWDDKWRLIVYDIPNCNKKARDAFRMKLKSLGLLSLQKSVWISPFECWNEIEFLCSVFDIDADNHVVYLTLNTLPKALERRFKLYFDL
jgi:hypothetical protein